MESHWQQVREYNNSLKEWKEYKLRQIMNSRAYRYDSLGVKYDHRLIKGTMHKQLFPDEKYMFSRAFNEALKHSDKQKEFFTESFKIPEVKSIIKLKNRREDAAKIGDQEKVKTYDWIIAIEIGKFKYSADQTYLSPENLKKLGITLSDIIDHRTKKLQCQKTVQYLVDNHHWFKSILEELSEKGSLKPLKSSELENLEKEYEYLQLEDSEREETLNLGELKLQYKKFEKYTQLVKSRSEYNRVLSQHYEYFSNVVYELHEKEYIANKIGSIKRLEKIIKEFAWFYKRLFWADKKQYQIKERNRRNAKRKKSDAFAKRRAMVQDCKKRGLNKTQTAKELNLNRKTVAKYWE